ncbi:MAG TPA: response regulator [Deltaproteobacteria bacterium]|nr:response regulator [Deltaproteobacteria bacterium]HOM28150.1 response regulator [Deltaproteobacteria bacterium]HPP79290.1 response regulator [Deltaproteobacteria bacterium]
MEKILIVDDSSTVRKFLATTLKTKNFRCVEASDGFDALEKLAQNPDVRLIISDLNMPNMDGIEFISAVRKDPQFKDIPIIMLTTDASPENRKLAFETGANLYLVKPSPAHIILFKVQSLLYADK